LHADIGLDLVIHVDHLGLDAADPAVQVIERDLDRVAHVLADDPLRPRQRGDESDLDLLLRRRRQRESKARGDGAGDNEVEWFSHASSP
jgi:hypothetical protein